MKTAHTQLALIKAKLHTDGYITRNWCLKRFVSRLGARISDLKKEGMDFTTTRVPNKNGWDYKYIVK